MPVSRFRRFRHGFVLALLTSGCIDEAGGGGGAGIGGGDTTGNGPDAGVTGGMPSTGSGASTGGKVATGATVGATTGSSTATGGGNVCDGPRPGPDNTGVPPGVVLTPSGSITVDTDGAVVEGLDIDGSITVLANDVTIRNVRIRSADYYPIRYFDNDNTGLVVEDSEIEGLSADVTSALGFANYTARRLNVHGGADGFKADANVLIEDCWVHDLFNGPDQHNDAVQSTGGKGVTIRHSDLSGASNAAVQTGDEGGATEDLTVECSWLSGGGWTLNIRGSGATVPRNTKILNNRFGRDHGYGPWTIDDPNPTLQGNVYDDNGEAIQ